MDLRELGKTQLKATPIGLGLAALGRPAYINLGHAEDMPESPDVEALREQAHRVLDVAWQNGVRYFDAARSYGRAEDFLGTWLASRNIPPNEVTVASKWGYTYTANWQLSVPEGSKHEVKDHTLPVLDRQIGESQQILGNWLDLYQIHSATIESGVFDNDEVLARLANLRDTGLSIGFSASGPQQADTIRKGMSIERGGRPVFSTVQATWNILEQSAGNALAEAHDAGRGVIIKEALANGRLTPRNRDANFQTKHDRLFQMAKEKDVTIDTIATACVLNQTWVDVVLSGATTHQQLISNLRALDLIHHAPLKELLADLESPEFYWSTRSGLAWN